ncbi:adenylate/guanylate cyclase domain-containing protein [Roseibium limicola]|uniref:Adenylate/guanylate cyclase domain-containing protein n=1 Tax=Roseibium limicola TaxID=2816037 RepID=A0A939EPK0_9HYPH|nr:adenylate/guanylate cyclase domain-containing protein [Roseibium limicola]MBO0344764.1 adenylate/guanylate cyclase domain-containing protein [Roseibium limicola]
MVLEAPLISAEVVQWLYGEALGKQDTLALIESLAERLRAGNVPVDRATTGIMILHPSVRAEAAVWTSDGTHELRRYMQNEQLDESYHNSPLKIVYEEGLSVRRRITAQKEDGEFGIIPDLRKEGYTDYIVLPMPFSDGSIKSISYATKAPGGFSSTHLAVFDSIIRPLALVCEMSTLRRTAQTLLDTYVGPRAGNRVLHGTIKRGEGEWISAVVSFADLRGFTKLSNELPPDKLIAFLNHYFGAMTDAVEAHGGEVLKYIGDEVMAIFPYGDGTDPQEAAMRALKAARETTAAIQDINTNNCCVETPDMRVGIALHAGDVFFGNVGSENRLDFTVIGPTVNLAARIAELAKDLDADILVSDTIADLMGCRAGLYGRYQVKGFDDPVSVFAPSLVSNDASTWCPESTASRDREAN